jgi:hypothetical protein
MCDWQRILGEGISQLGKHVPIQIFLKWVCNIQLHRSISVIKSATQYTVV